VAARCDPEQGRQALQNALPFWERAEDRFRRALGSDDWNTMLPLLDRIRVAAVRAEELRTNNHPHEQSM